MLRTEKPTFAFCSLDLICRKCNHAKIQDEAVAVLAWCLLLVTMFFLQQQEY